MVALRSRINDPADNFYIMLDHCPRPLSQIIEQLFLPSLSTLFLFSLPFSFLFRSNGIMSSEILNRS